MELDLGKAGRRSYDQREGKVKAVPAVFGIDPGASGAVAVYDGEKLDLLAFESDDTKTRGSKTDYKQVVGFIEVNVLTYGKYMAAYIEDVHAMPKQGVSSTFKFGYNAGAVYGICASFLEDLPKLVLPTLWKPRLGLGNDKKNSIARAVELFPDAKPYFYGPRGGERDGPAEASLLAWYGWHTEQGDIEFLLDGLRKKHSRVK